MSANKFESDHTELPFYIERLQDDREGGDFVMVRFPRTDDRSEGSIIDPISITSTPNKLLTRLEDAGAELPDRSQRGSWIRDLIDQLPKQAGTLSMSTGWKGDATSQNFLMPDHLSGRPGDRLVLAAGGRDHCLAQGLSGTLDSWRLEVASKALAAAPAATAILTALACPLLAFSELREGFILNLAGNSSSGKTTANIAAASVFGDPRRIKSWNATKRGLSELAAANNDLCLILDDAEQVDENPKRRLKKIAEVTHTLTSGKGKTYSKVMAGPDRLPKLEYRCIVLSSSPHSIEKDAMRNQDARTDGDRVRLFEIQIRHGNEGGIFKGYAGHQTPKNSARLSDELTSAAKANFGFAGVTWIDYLTTNQASLREVFGELTTDFLRKVAPNANSVHGRIANKVALIYAAGCIARAAGVIPWTVAEVLEVGRYAYSSIITAGFGRVFDPHAAVCRFRHALNNRTAFPRLRVDKLAAAAPVDGAEGYIWQDRRRIYAKLDAFKRHLVSPNREVTRDELKIVIDYLDANKVLLRNQSHSITRDIRIGSAKSKYLVLSRRALIKVAGH